MRVCHSWGPSLLSLTKFILLTKYHLPDTDMTTYSIIIIALLDDVQQAALILPTVQ